MWIPGQNPSSGLPRRQHGVGGVAEEQGHALVGQRELARRVVLSKSNLSRLADRLEEAGLVAREASPEDGRGYDLALTRAGRAMRRRMWPVYETQIQQLFAAHLSLEEARVVGEALARAVKAARDGKIPA